MATSEIALQDVRAGVGVAFDAMAFHQHDAILRRFAEVVTAIGGDRGTRLPSSDKASPWGISARANEPRHSAQRHSTLVIL